MKKTCILFLIVTMFFVVPFSASGVDKVMTSLVINGPTEIGMPDTIRYYAIAYYSDGTSQDVSRYAEWWSDSSYVAILWGRLAINAPDGHQFTITIYYYDGTTAMNATKTVTAYLR